MHTSDIQNIQLTGTDAEGNTHYVHKHRVVVYPSVASSRKENVHASNKLVSNDLINYSWSHEYYYGNLLAYHPPLSLLAYVLRHTANKDANTVRVCQLRHATRILLKDFQSRVLDLAFSFHRRPSELPLLAVLEELGDVRIYRLQVDPVNGAIDSQPVLLLHLAHPNRSNNPLTEQLSLNSEIPIQVADKLTTEGSLKRQPLPPVVVGRLTWCRGSDNDMEEDVELADVTQLLSITLKDQLFIVAVDALLTRPRLTEQNEENDPWPGLVVDRETAQPLLTYPSEPVMSSVSLDADTTKEQHITDVCFCIDGNVLATVDLGGNCHFYDVNYSENLESSSSTLTMTHIKAMQPHDGDPLYSMNFLDNLLASDSEPIWKSLLTGANYNRQLKVWRCDRWECIYQLDFSVHDLATEMLPCLQLRVDDTGKFVLLSDVKRTVLYTIEFGKTQETDAEATSTTSFPRLASISEFLLRDPCLSLCLLGPGKVAASRQELDVLLTDMDSSTMGNTSSLAVSSKSHPNRKLYVGIQFAHVHTRNLKQSTLKFSFHSHGDSDTKLSAERVHIPQHGDDEDEDTTVVSNGTHHVVSPGVNNQDISTHQHEDTAELLLHGPPCVSSSFTQVSSDSSVDLAKRPIMSPSVSREQRLESADYNYSEDYEESSIKTMLEENTSSMRHSGSRNLNQKDAMPFEATGDAWPSVMPDQPVLVEHEAVAKKGPLDLFPSVPAELMETAACATGDATTTALMTHVMRMLNSVLQSQQDQQQAMNQLAHAVDMLKRRQATLLQEQQQVLAQWPSNMNDLWRPLEDVTKAQFHKLEHDLGQRLSHMEERVTLSNATNSRAPSAQDIAEQNKLQKELVSSSVDTVYNKVAAQMRESLQSALKPALEKNIPKITEPIRREISQQIQDRLVAVEQAVSSHVVQVLKNKSFVESLSQEMSNSMRKPLAMSYRELAKQSMVPALDKGIAHLGQELNQAFAIALKDFEHQVSERVVSRVQALLQEHQQIIRQTQTEAQHQWRQALQQQNAELTQKLLQRLDTLERNQEAVVKRELAESLGSPHFENRVRQALAEDLAGLRSHVAMGPAASQNTQHGSAPSPTPSVASVSVPPLERVKTQVDIALSVGRLNDAFTQALQSRSFTLVEYVCQRIPVDSLSQQPCPLEQNVLISLIQQLAMSMDSNPSIALNYMEEALMNLDRKSAVYQTDQAFKILTKVRQRLTTLLEGPTEQPWLTAQLKQVARRCKAMCSVQMG